MSAQAATALKSPWAPAADDGLGRELARLNHRLDQIAAQVGHLYQRTLAVEELRDELVPVARDAMGALSQELQAIEHEFNSQEVIYLLRKLLRNTPRFISLLDWLESAEGLLVELEPLSKQVLHDLVMKLQQLEEAGHFRLVQGGLDLVDRVARHYDQEDIERLADNVITILDTVKSMTQPDMLALANSALGALREGQPQAARPVGLWGMLKTLRDPEVQQGMAVMLEVLKQVSRQRALPENE